jgi:hypothetical protein
MIRLKQTKESASCLAIPIMNSGRLQQGDYSLYLSDIPLEFDGIDTFINQFQDTLFTVSLYVL